MGKICKKAKPWLENKTAQIRRVSKPRSARAYRVTKKFGSTG